MLLVAFFGFSCSCFLPDPTLSFVTLVSASPYGGLLVRVFGGGVLKTAVVF